MPLGDNRKQDSYGPLPCDIYILVTQFNRLYWVGDVRHCMGTKMNWTLITTKIEEGECQLGTNQEW